MLPKAVAQHKAYQDCLADLGVRVISLPAKLDLPDAVFVEDSAAVVDEVAVISILGVVNARRRIARRFLRQSQREVSRCRFIRIVSGLRPLSRLPPEQAALLTASLLALCRLAARDEPLVALIRIVSGLRHNVGCPTASVLRASLTFLRLGLS